MQGEVWFGTHVKGSNAKGDVVGVIALQRTSVSLIHSWMQYMGARVDLSRWELDLEKNAVLAFLRATS